MGIDYQHPNTVSSTGFEVIGVRERKVACDGGKGALGHPRVFLQIDHETNQVVCPYCSRHFYYQEY